MGIIVSIKQLKMNSYFNFDKLKEQANQLQKQASEAAKQYMVQKPKDDSDAEYYDEEDETEVGVQIQQNKPQPDKALQVEKQKSKSPSKSRKETSAAKPMKQSSDELFESLADQNKSAPTKMETGADPLSIFNQLSKSEQTDKSDKMALRVSELEEQLEEHCKNQQEILIKMEQDYQLKSAEVHQEHQSHVTKLEEQLQEKDQKIECLEQSNSKLLEQIQQSDSVVADLRNQVQDLEAKQEDQSLVQKLQDQIQQLEDNHIDQSVVNDLHEQIQKLQDKHQMALSQVNVLTDSLAEARESLSKYLSAANSDIVADSQSLASQITKNNEYLSEIERRLVHFANLGSVNQDSKKFIDQERHRHELQIKTLQDRSHQDLEDQKHKFETTINNLLVQQDEKTVVFENQIEKLKKDHQDEVKHLESKLGEQINNDKNIHKKAINDLMTDHQEQLEVERTALNRQISTLQEEKQQLIASHSEQIENSVSEQAAKLTELNSIHNEEVASLNQVVLSLKSELADLIQKHKTDLQNTVQLNKDLMTRVQDKQKKDLEEATKLTYQQAYSKVYSALEGLLVDQFKVSGKFNKRDPSASGIADTCKDFTEMVKEELERGQVNEKVINQLSSMWIDAQERFQRYQLQNYFKKAKQDSNAWISNRHKWEPKVAEKNEKLLKMFDMQLVTLFQIHQHCLAETQAIGEHRQQKETLAFQLSKLQKDNKEIASLGSQTAKLKEQIQTQEHEKLSMKQQIQDALQEKLTSKLRLQEHQTKLENLIAENQSFKDKVLEQDDDLKRLRKQLQISKNQQQQIEELKQINSKLEQAKEWLECQIEGKDSEMKEVKQTISNLQRALQQKQDEGDQLMIISEKEQAQLKQAVLSLENKLKKTEAQSQMVDQLNDKIKQLDEQVGSLIEDKSSLETQKQEVTKYAAELVEQVKKEQEGKEFMIDRRMINTFLVQFVNPKSDEQTKSHMLDAMSKILGFTMEEKQQLGMVKRQSPIDGDQQTANQQPKKQGGLRESLVSFLMGDDDFE